MRVMGYLAQRIQAGYMGTNIIVCVDFETVWFYF